MRPRFLMFLLTLGAIGGFASGFASLHRHHPEWGSEGSCGWHERAPAPPAPPAPSSTPAP